MGILRPVVAALPAACRSPRGSFKFISAAWAAGTGPRSLNAKHIERGAYRHRPSGLHRTGAAIGQRNLDDVKP